MAPELSDLLDQLTDRMLAVEDRVRELNRMDSGAGGSGTGVAGRVAIWTSTTDIGSDAGLTYSAAVLTVTGNIIGSGQVRFGGAPAGVSGTVNARAADAVDNSPANVLNLYKGITAGTPAVGFGVAVTMSADTTTTPNTLMAYDQAIWTDPTHATRKARRSLTVYDTAQRTAIRMDANGTIAVVTIPGGLSIGSAGAAALGQILASGSAVDPVFSAQILNADTNTYRVGMTINHETSGTAAAGFGIAYRTQLEDDGGTVRVTSDDITAWADPGAATYKARRRMFVSDITTARECIRIETDGSAAMIGFLGAAAVVRPTSTTDLRQALIDLGLYASGGASPLDLNGGELRTGLASHEISDAATNTSPVVESINHLTSNTTPAASFGVTLQLAAHSDDAGTNTLRAQANVNSIWTTATDASRKARVSINVFDTASREAIRMEGDGTVARIGFLGAAAVVKQATITQTYATTSTTLANDTSANFPAGGTGTAAGGWDTAANRDLAITRFNALRVDVDNVKNVLNTVIDSLQAYGLNG